MNIKGMTMVQTIITLILALVVFVVIVFAFTRGSSLFGSTTGNFAPSNVQTHVSGCQVACSVTKDRYDFCEKQREIGFGDEQSVVIGTCQDLAGSHSNFGFKSCPTLC